MDCFSWALVDTPRRRHGQRLMGKLLRTTPRRYNSQACHRSCLLDVCKHALETSRFCKRETRLGNTSPSRGTKHASLASLATVRRVIAQGANEPRPGSMFLGRGYLNASLAWIPLPRRQFFVGEWLLIKSFKILRKSQKFEKNMRKNPGNSRKIPENWALILKII